MIHGVAVCAGVGGSQLALRLLFGERFRTVLYVEREASAAALLVARMEDKALDRAPVWDDLGSAPGLALRGRVDLVTAGLPCQPYSLAGKRAGNEDERAIWPSFVRFVEECEPGALFFENVPGFLKHFEGAWRVLRDMGFEFAPPVQAAAADFGAPHRRERVYFLAAHPCRARLEEWLRVADDTRSEREAAQRGSRGPADADGADVRDEPGWGRGPDGEGASEPGRDRQGSVPFGGGGDDPHPDCGGLEGQRRLWVLDRERETLRPYADGCCGRGCTERSPWSAESPLLRVADGPAHRVDRLRGIGNSVVPQAVAAVVRHQMQWLAKEIV